MRQRFESTHEGVHVDGITIESPARITCIACQQEREQLHVRAVLAVGDTDVGDLCVACVGESSQRRFTLDDVCGMLLRRAVAEQPACWAANVARVMA